MTDGGLVIPQVVDEEMYDYWVEDLFFGPRPPRVPLTRWQRIRFTIRGIPHRIRWGIHDALFPDCATDYDD